MRHSWRIPDPEVLGRKWQARQRLQINSVCLLHLLRRPPGRNTQQPRTERCLVIDTHEATPRHTGSVSAQ